MDLLGTIALLVSLAALFSYANHRFLRLPVTVGLMLISLFLSLAIVGLGAAFPPLLENARTCILQGAAGPGWERTGIDFSKTLLEGMLSALLFAGALHVSLSDLAKHKWIVGVLATVGVVTSTLIVGGVMMVAFRLMGLEVPPLYCFLFGALISPTDPIAVMAILKSAGAPKSLETKIGCESLLNDGVGVVVFLSILEMASGSASPSPSRIAGLFLQEAGGGLLLGLVLGGIGYYLIKSIDQYQVEVILTLALVLGGFAVARALHVAAPIAVVTAGLVVGNQARRAGMSSTTEEYVDKFWELVDEILNALLFVLIGLEVLVLQFRFEAFLAGLIAIPVVLMARFVSVALPIGVARLRHEFSPRVVQIMTWGGLRGAISVALALSIPAGPLRELLLVVTYVVVVFSIAVQGLTIKTLIERSRPDRV